MARDDSKLVDRKDKRPSRSLSSSPPETKPSFKPHPIDKDGLNMPSPSKSHSQSEKSRNTQRQTTPQSKPSSLSSSTSSPSSSSSSSSRRPVKIINPTDPVNQRLRPTAGYTSVYSNNTYHGRPTKNATVLDKLRKKYQGIDSRNAKQISKLINTKKDSINNNNNNNSQREEEEDNSSSSNNRKTNSSNKEKSKSRYSVPLEYMSLLSETLNHKKSSSLDNSKNLHTDQPSSKLNDSKKIIQHDRKLPLSSTSRKRGDDEIKDNHTSIPIKSEEPESSSRSMAININDGSDIDVSNSESDYDEDDDDIEWEDITKSSEPTNQSDEDSEDEYKLSNDDDDDDDDDDEDGYENRKQKNIPHIDVPSLSTLDTNPETTDSPASSNGGVVISIENPEPKPRPGQFDKNGKNKKKTVKRRKDGSIITRISKAERQERRLIHKLHLACLMMHVSIRNQWCNNPDLLQRYSTILPKSILKELVPTQQDLQKYEKYSKESRELILSRNFLDGLKHAMNHWNYRVFETATDRGIKLVEWCDIYNRDRIVESKVNKEKFLKILIKRRRGNRDVSAQGFCTLLRSIGLSARLICSVQPLDFTSNYPITNNPFADDKNKQDLTEQELEEVETQTSSGSLNIVSSYPVYWVEVWNPYISKWISVDPCCLKYIEVANVHTRGKSKFEPPISESSTNCMRYVLAFEPNGAVKDVTRRYAFYYNAKTLRKRIDGKPNEYPEDVIWYQDLLKFITNKNLMSSMRMPSNPALIEDAETIAARDILEKQELELRNQKEPLPSRIADFKNHPVYVLERHLHANEILEPMIPCGKLATTSASKSRKSSAATNPGVQNVYRREHVKVVRSARYWYQQGRVLKVGATAKKFVVKKPKALPDPAPKISRKRKVPSDEDDEEEEYEEEEETNEPSIMDLDDDEGDVRVGLYSYDQTELFVPPPVDSDGTIPKNIYGNIDVFVPSMVPKGAVLLPMKDIEEAAKILRIPYARAIVGFDFGGQGSSSSSSSYSALNYGSSRSKGSGTAQPRTGGIVVAEQFKDAVLLTYEHLQMEKEEEKHQMRLVHSLVKWKKFLLALRIKAQLNRDHGVIDKNGERVFKPLDEQKEQEAATEQEELIDENEDNSWIGYSSEPDGYYNEQQGQQAGVYIHDYDDEFGGGGGFLIGDAPDSGNGYNNYGNDYNNDYGGGGGFLLDDDNNNNDQGGFDETQADDDNQSYNQVEPKTEQKISVNNLNTKEKNQASSEIQSSKEIQQQQPLPAVKANHIETTSINNSTISRHISSSNNTQTSLTFQNNMFSSTINSSSSSSSFIQTQLAEISDGDDEYDIEIGASSSSDDDDNSHIIIDFEEEIYRKKDEHDQELYLEGLKKQQAIKQQQEEEERKKEEEEEKKKEEEEENENEKINEKEIEQKNNNDEKKDNNQILLSVKNEKQYQNENDISKSPKVTQNKDDLASVSSSSPSSPFSPPSPDESQNSEGDFFPESMSESELLADFDEEEESYENDDDE